VAACKKIVDNIAKDYVRMMKFSDSLYKAKMLKRAGLGRMCTAVKRLAGSLSYLEEVRQHLGRLPAINPATRTLILTGYPNVGKSSFMNVVTQANVDVQPYAFTTKSLFVGHLDYNYVRWQVIDTPGILDHPLEDRNTIEMTAVTALAHLPAAVLFFVDISEMCGYPIPVQVALFHSIKPLFRNRPLLIILNKTDVRKVSELSAEEQKLLESMKETSDEQDIQFFQTSCATKDGVDAARAKACDLLLEKRVDQKVKQGKADTLRSRLHITSVQTRTDRPPCVPESVLKQRAGQGDTAMGDDEVPFEEKTERERMIELGGAGVYSVDTWRKAILDDSSWKYDVVPEIMDGQNVFDFVDPDIERKLAELEKEEELLMAEEKLRIAEDESTLKAWGETQGVLDEIHSRMRQRRVERRMEKSRNHNPIPRTLKKKKEKQMQAELKTKAEDPEKAMEGMRGRSASKKRATSVGIGDKRKRDATAGGEGDGDEGAVAALRARSASAKGLPSEEAGQTVEKRRRKKMRLTNKLGRKGEGDHWVPDLKPKHLYSGKRGIGKTDRR